MEHGERVEELEGLKDDALEKKNQLEEWCTTAYGEVCTISKKSTSAICVLGSDNFFSSGQLLRDMRIMVCIEICHCFIRCTAHGFIF